MSGQYFSTSLRASPTISLSRASARSVSRSVSSQQREVRCLHAVVGIAARPRPDVLALSKAGCDEYLQGMFDLVVVSYDQGVLATDVTHVNSTL